jgi:hypothetical protein
MEFLEQQRHGEIGIRADDQVAVEPFGPRLVDQQGARAGGLRQGPVLRIGQEGQVLGAGALEWAQARHEALWVAPHLSTHLRRQLSEEVAAHEPSREMLALIARRR